jgi:ferrochelatase
LRDLACQGRRHVVILSPSFPVDCLETLEEIDLEYRKAFLAAGGETLARVPALNGTREHAIALAAVLETMNQGWPGQGMVAESRPTGVERSFKTAG